jgi:hypothetical protein
MGENLGRARRLTTVTMLIALGAAAQSISAQTVTNTNDSGSDSLRQSILSASPGATIDFAIPLTDRGCSTGSCTITLTSGELTITQGVTIQGPGAQLLTISGNDASRIFNVTAATAVSIGGMTLRDGRPSDALGGGAIVIHTGALVTPFDLSDAVVTDNNVTFSSNPLGGGIDNEGGTVTITRSSIVNNVASFRGGGIQNQGLGSMKIVNSTIAGNTAGTFGIGGGVRSLLPLTLTNCTIFGNSAQTAGNISRFSGTISFQNTIIAGGVLLGGVGTAPDIDGSAGLNSLDFNLIQDTSGATITGVTTHNITGASPLLGALANNGGPTPTLLPSPVSPAIDAGSAVIGITTDQRGFARPMDFSAIANAGDGSDIGAVELGDQIFVGTFD